jgi:hypothetical protein
MSHMAAGAGTPGLAGQSTATHTYTLWCHDAHGKMSADELVVSPEVFPSIRAGDLLFMWDPALSSATSSSAAAAATAGSTGGGAALSPSPPPPLISARRRRRREQERGALLLAVSRLHGPPPSAPSVAPAKGTTRTAHARHTHGTRSTRHTRAPGPYMKLSNFLSFPLSPLIPAVGPTLARACVRAGSGFAGNLNYMNTLQVSLSNKIADLFGFVQRQAIAAEVLTPETAPQVLLALPSGSPLAAASLRTTLLLSHSFLRSLVRLGCVCVCVCRCSCVFTPLICSGVAVAVVRARWTLWRWCSGISTWAARTCGDCSSR